MADAGTPGADPGQGGNEPSFVTIEQMNKAITARFSEFQKKQEKAFEGLTSTLTGLTTKLEEVAKPAPPAGSPDPKDGDPMVKGLQKQIQELKAQADRAEASAASEREKTRQNNLRQTLTDTLVKNGVDASRVKHAVGFLIDAEKRVRYQEDGDDIVFTDSDGTDLDLTTGVKSWVGSDDGKFYLPPRGVTGSGDRGTGKAPKTTQKSAAPTSTDLGQSILEMIGQPL